MLTAEDILNAKGGTLVTVTPDCTLLEAVRTMNAKRVGSVLISEGGRIMGIWTERDLLRQTAQEGFDPARMRIHDHMVRDLVYTPHHNSVYELMDKILGRRQRHLLITRNDSFIGLLTSGDVMRAFMEVKQQELQNLNALVSWEYYEEWRWTRDSGKIEHPTTGS